MYARFDFRAKVAKSQKAFCPYNEVKAPIVLFHGITSLYSYLKKFEFLSPFAVGY
jgi:hypothetical protein